MKDVLRSVFTDTLTHLQAQQRQRVPMCLGAARDHVARGGRVVLIAFGKAARGMAEAALAVLPAHRVRGVLVPPEPDAAPLGPLQVVPGGHPLPTAGSFAAARAALTLCEGAGPHDHVVFLVSGGGSALLELPYDERIDVAAWRAFYAALVGCGAPIERINALRRRVSAIKGGRLALAAAQAAGQTTVLVHDVRAGWGDVASGPTWLVDPGDEDEASAAFRMDTTTCQRELAALGIAAMPPQLATALAEDNLPPLPTVPDRLRSRCAWLVALDETMARRHAAAALQRRGVTVDTEPDVDDEPVDAAAEALLLALQTLRTRHARGPVAVVTTGELAVRLPARPGLGGRNQQFALACAQRIAGQPITVLSGGTDGIDGNSPAAGAVVDGDTLAQATARGLDVADALRRCDAFPLLQALGGTLTTGPTGTNVRDLRIAVHHG